MPSNEFNELLNEFSQRWTPDKVYNITLKEYVGLENQDTFCQWIETKTRILGSIKGMTSIKFGIYERKDQKDKPKNYTNDDKYSWLKGYGDSRESAFENIKQDILTIINFANDGKFSEIDHILLPDIFKWKISFLYSNERLIPIFKRDVLFRIANYFGLKTDKTTTISEIQNLMISNKPAHLNVYNFMRQLFDQFGDDGDKKEIVDTLNQNRKKRISRIAAKDRNTDTQTRLVAGSYVAEQKHNKIQKELERLLISQFGRENVILEENHVDVKVIQPNYIAFYEVKSSSYPAECIKEALGQILLYSLNDNDKRQKKHIVVGQYPANESEEKYINFLKENLKLEFEYQSIKIE
ncbi:hypothetical protein [Dyadobacter sp. 3J3]|uniref:hypothetical protein n=1 Tax=Dyadobacter sp. 3J3 TaxID=2606600 RepID=UPI001358A0E3|nr:hypothetical protein [Dyadobacter sp. 3J3]